MKTVYFDGWDVTAAGCKLKAITWTAPVKKQYIVDIPGADGTLDMASWFGGPRYESRTMTIVLEPSGISLFSLWSKLAQELYGSTYHIRASVDPDYYWNGEVQNITTVSGMLGELIISVRVEPYKYRVIPDIYGLPKKEVEVDAQIMNMGTRVEIPSVTVKGEQLSIAYGGTVINMTTGTYSVPELAVRPRSELQFRYTGGPGEITIREAYL